MPCFKAGHGRHVLREIGSIQIAEAACAPSSLRPSGKASVLKEHACKAKRASDTEPLRSALTHTRSTIRPSRTLTRCASANRDVLRGFEPDVSQSYHNPRF